MFDVVINRPGEESSSCAQNQLTGDKRTLDCPLRRCFGNSSPISSRRILTFGKPVNFIIEKDDININISANTVNKMIPSYG